MESTSKTDASALPLNSLRAQFSGDVLQQIRQHARSSMRAEICGVLIGEADGGVTRISARIAGEGAAQGGAHVTFTQDTWEHIFRVKDAEYPTQSIVGWYHSHPGFGIFLSDHDLFIHENFFSAPHQVAWVFDPHSDEEGCFGWIAGKVAPLEQIEVSRKHKLPAPEQAQKEAATRAAATAEVRSPALRPKKGSSAEYSIGRTCLLLAAGGLLFLSGFALPHYFPASQRVWLWIGSSNQPNSAEETAAPASPIPETPDRREDFIPRTLIVPVQPASSDTPATAPPTNPPNAPPQATPAPGPPPPLPDALQKELPSSREDNPGESKPTPPTDPIPSPKPVPEP